ncbi:prepilin-type N-terminal cleavage/methylation domain-containing protein [Viridibacillus arenosi]|nr:prepilin-type N-terminal cleavage/methylation domain-containing protein [Viridibacillus arenosi]
MMNKIKKMIKNERGMTLIELLAVIVIIAIIALIAIPAIGNIINNSNDKAILADASNILSGAKIAFTDGECSENECTADQLKSFVTKDGTDLSGVSVKRADGVYTVTYPALAEMKGKFKDEATDGTITSDKLAKLMGNKKETTPPTGN